MSNCPFCGHPIEDANRESLNCPHCGKDRLSGQPSSQTINVGRDQDASSAGSNTLGYSDGDFEPNPSGQKTDRDDVAETVRSPRHSQSTDSPNPPSEKSPLSSTGQIREFVRSVAISQARPTATIQQNDNRQVHIGSLVLQRRSLASERDPNADQSDYRIIGSVGEGGMGAVYSAQQTSVRRDVAIKTLKPALAYDERERKKFLKEACITAGLDHPNIVPVHDLGINDEGTLFYSMKLIRGDEWINVMKTKSRPENLEILLRVCDAIGFAHSRGFMHRDIKAENVMLGSFGEVLVTDWGLAVELNSPNEFSFGGSPAYMAPEMASHQVEKIGIATDIYLLGATLFEIVTGQPPHPGRTATECVMAAAENKVREFPTSDTLLDVARRAISTQVTDRFQSVADLQAAIRNYQSQMESIAFTENGIRTLQSAMENSDSEAFSRAVFSFQDAIRMWPENLKAVELEREAKLEHARCALQQKNFDLGLSVLEPETDEELQLHRRLVKGQTESRKWRFYLKLARTAALIAGVIAIAGFVVSLVLWQRSEFERARADSEAIEAREQRDIADSKTIEAQQQRDIADSKTIEAQQQRDNADSKTIEAQQQRDIAETQRDRADSKTIEAQQQRDIADSKTIEAQQQRDIAETQRDRADSKTIEAQQQRDIAEANSIEAQQQRDMAEQRLSASLIGRYGANIKYAGAELGRAKTKNAIETLDDIRLESQLAKKDLGWELHRLYQLCHENELDLLALPSDSSVQFFESSPDGKTQVAVLSDGSVWKRELAASDKPIEFKPLENVRLAVSDKRSVSSISVSPNGQLMAVGYLGNQYLEPVADSLEIFDLRQGTIVQMDAQEEAQLGVSYAGFLDSDRIVTVSDQLYSDGSDSVRNFNVWSIAKKAPIDRGTRITEVKASDSDRWSPYRGSKQGLEKFAYLLHRKNYAELLIFSFDEQNPNGQNPTRVPVLVKSDVTSLAVVETERKLDISGTACICGLSDGSLILPVTFANEVAVVSGKLDVNADGKISAEDDCQIFDTKTKKLRAVIDGRIDLSNDGIIDKRDKGDFQSFSIVEGRFSSKDQDFRIQNIALTRVIQLAANAHATAVTGLDVFGEYVVSSSPNGDLGVWTWNKSNLTRETTLLGHTASIAGVVVDSETRTLTSVDTGKTLTSVDIEDHRPVRQWSLDGLQDEIRFRSPNLPVCTALAESNGSFVSLVGNSVGELQIFRPEGSRVPQPLNASMENEESRFIYDAERDWIIAATKSGDTVIWSAKTGKRLESFDGESNNPVLDYDQANSRYLTAGNRVGKVAVWEKGALRNVVGEFQSLEKDGSFDKDSSRSIQASKLSKDGKRIVIWAGDDLVDNTPFISLFNVESGKRLGWCVFTEGEFRKAVCSMMFEQIADEFELVVAFRLPIQQGKQAQVEVCWFQPNENQAMHITAKKNFIKAPDSFDPDREFNLYFVGQLDGQQESVTVVREFTSGSKVSDREKAIAQVWSQSIWTEDAMPDREIPLGEVHPDSRFEMTGTLLTYVDPDGRPFQVDLLAGGAKPNEIDGVADAISQDIKPDQTLRKIVRECKWLPDNKMLIAGMSHAWIVEKNQEQQWTVSFRNLPKPQCRYVGLSHDGRSGLVHHADGRIHLFQGNLFESDPKLVALDGFYDLVGLSTDGKQIAVYDRERGLRFLDFAESLENEKASARKPLLDAISTESPLTALAWSPDGLVVGGASQNGEIHLWDVSNGKPWVQPKTGLPTEGPVIEKISISPPNSFDQRVVSVIDSKQQLRLFATRSRMVDEDLNLKERVWTAGPTQKNSTFFKVVDSADFNPNFLENGFRIALGFGNNLVEIWLVDLKEDDGFSSDNEARENQLFRVFDFPVTTRELNVIDIGFDPSGHNLGTLTAENMTVWLTSGWDKFKPEPTLDDKQTSLPNVAQ